MQKLSDEVLLRLFLFVIHSMMQSVHSILKSSVRNALTTQQSVIIVMKCDGKDEHTGADMIISYNFLDHSARQSFCLNMS